MSDPRIVLAFAGDLETTATIPWLANRYRAETIAVTLDLGQRADLSDVRQRALAAGAVRAHVIDAREEFARDFVLPALQAHAIREDGHPLPAALARPLLARHLVEVARMEQAATIAHGCRSEAGRRRLETPARALDQGLAILAPVGLPSSPAQAEAMPAAEERGRARSAVVERAWRVDENLWGRSIDCGMLEDPRVPLPQDVCTRTRAPEVCPDVPALVEIEFVQGHPTRVNGVAMGLVELIASLETIGGAHGVGRLDAVRRDPAGRASREIIEAPAATILHLAYRHLESMTLASELERLARPLGLAYADLVDQGSWFSPTREAIDAFVGRARQHVTGTARVGLHKGSCAIADGPSSIDRSRWGSFL